MTTLLQPPEVKVILFDYLADLVDAPVLSERPDDGVTKRFVRVIASGGPGRQNRIRQIVQVTIDSYAPTTGTADDLARAVDAAIYALPASTQPINSVPWATTPQDYPDPDVGPRYTATYQLAVLCR